MQNINTVCVIGSGVMGSGIAAQVANAKTNVILLDIADKVSGDKNKIVKDAYDKLFTNKPSPLSHPDYAKYITIGNLEDDLELINKADFIIEAIVENLDIKEQLYNSIIPYIKNDAFLASNTSTLPLKKLKANLPSNIAQKFIITHFFNPPRYMELVELVSDDKTNKTNLDIISNFITKKLGKTIVNCNDTPGFIANRVGCFLLELVTRKALNEGLNPQIIDYIFSKDLGFPSTGIFGLYDLIGCDVMELISKSLLASLPQDDKYHEIYSDSDILTQMKKKNMIGRKAGGGFYKISKDEKQNTVKYVINPGNLNYEIASKDVSYDTKIYDNFIDNVLKIFFDYVCSLVPHVASDKKNIDKAMKLGYSLKYGPFELLSMRSRINKDNIKPDNKAQNKIILSNDSAQLQFVKNHYIFVIESKMNILDHDVFKLMIESVNYCQEKKLPMYILPSGNNFSAGANLQIFKHAIKDKNFNIIDEFLDLGQKAMLKLKYATVPIISCAKGFALGGGCEILLHSSLVVAHQNLVAGLVEMSLGLIPAFGGTKEMFLRSNGNSKKLLDNLKNIITYNKSSSADYFAINYSVHCVLNMNKNFILEEAINEENLSENQTKSYEAIYYDIPQISEDILINITDTKLNNLQMDVVKFFQKIIDKKSVTEQQLLDFEREQFLSLASRLQ